MLTQPRKDELVQQAIEARKQAYAPYSHYAVGAALLTKTGKVFPGVNVENAVFPLTNCAERSAVYSAVTQGEKEFEAIAVVTENAGTPCGSCRQVLAEFGLDILVLIANTEGKVVCEMTVAELLPGAFTSVDLVR
jgi:cytidine deaminase